MEYNVYQQCSRAPGDAAADAGTHEESESAPLPSSALQTPSGNVNVVQHGTVVLEHGIDGVHLHGAPILVQSPDDFDDTYVARTNVLDVAEYLPILMLDAKDRTIEFREQLVGLAAKCPKFALALERFDASRS